jgi:flagellar motor switch protein FliN/FliY
MPVSIVKTPEQTKIETPVDKNEAATTQQVNGELLRGVRVSLDVRLGKAPMTVEEMMSLKSGSVVALQASLADCVELYLNETLVARGEIVAVGDKYGVRIVEIAKGP